MKRMLLATALMLSLAVTVQAQKNLIVINHTTCEWFFEAYLDVPGSTNWTTAIHYSGSAVATFAASPPSTTTYNFYAHLASWADYLGSSATYTTQPPWVWSHVKFSPTTCDDGHNDIWVSGTDQGQSGAWLAPTGPYSSPASLTTCCGDNTITWTDLNNGDVQIDIY